MDPIAKRIKELTEDKGMSHAAFAEAIGVKRANISHIFSGRNNPSLDLVRKILEKFPETDPQWLILGKTPAPDKENKEEAREAPKKENPNDQAPHKGLNDSLLSSIPDKDPNKRIERIVIFYDDKTFASYEGET